MWYITMISYFSFYRTLFMVQLLAAAFLFTFRLRRRNHFWLRYAVMVAGTLLLSLMPFWQQSNPIELSLSFMGMFLSLFLMSFFCFDVPVMSLLFCHVAAYTTQHCAYCLSNCMLLFSKLNANIYGVYTEEVLITQFLPFNQVFGWIFSFAVYYFVYYLFFLFFGNRIRRNNELRLKSLPVLTVSTITMVISVFVNAAVVYGTVNGDLIVLVNIYNAVCCTFIMYMLFSIMTQTQMRDELASIYMILRKSQEQYEISKRTIEMINIKCHDLKHQIRQIGKAKLINEDALREISNVISIYDSEIKTGNPVLDTILTEKSLYCYKNEINLTCIADGTLLNFMNEAELYSLFGNALDNAISAVQKAADPQKRYIGLNISRVKGFVTVNVHNYYDGSIRYSENGMPITTKVDRENHGFGLKSIVYIVEKYGGKVSVQAEAHVFNLNIIFPVNIE